MFMVVYRSVKMLCDYERKRSDMKKITIDNAEYVVYGNNEKKDNLKPHIEVAETGIVPEGTERITFVIFRGKRNRTNSRSNYILVYK